MLVTLAQLLMVMPHAKARAAAFVEPLNAAMREFYITTEQRIEAFLAQIGHESGQLLYVEEIASGKAYEGRKDLGNVYKGDGVFFKGRGLIQITGRNNYRDCSLALFGDDRLLQFPELLEDPLHACRSAAWFWQKHGLNELADAGNFDRITRRINGGTNGAADRLALWEVAKEAIV